MHALYNVSAVIKHPLDVFRIDGTREMRIAVMFTITARRTDALKQNQTMSQNKSIERSEPLPEIHRV